MEIGISIQTISRREFSPESECSGGSMTLSHLLADDLTNESFVGILEQFFEIDLTPLKKIAWECEHFESL